VPRQDAQYFAFSDDIDVMGRSEEDTKQFSVTVIPNLGYEPGHLEVREKKLNNDGKRPLLGYLFRVTIYKFEITANTLITKILLILRVQFMEIGCQWGTQVKKVWEPLLYGNKSAADANG
jgi:hypothetical protein